ncbi:uncharacterized protein LOC129871475 [Solanum dulcamara]|uniref:uncharacterized protein LOC129871475 n=1 Tax=Solanum dulcamara TaxID=45834 RepID=UPI00248697E6|nr:uncharacterized protein LOC129871475 [Solanum dulcamara]
MHPMGQGIHISAGHGRGRGGTSSVSGPSNHIYALASRWDQQASPNVVTGILSIFSRDIYALIDLGSTLSYVSPFVDGRVGIKPESIDPFEIATSVGDSIRVKQGYKNCSVSICGCYTLADLLELDMTVFDVIIGMDWLSSCYANIDCRNKVVRLQLPNEPIIEWLGNTTLSRGKFISYLKARKMVRKGYIYYLVRVHYLEIEVLTFQSVPVVNEYPDVFADELPGLPPEWEIEFTVDVLLDTQPISIPP